MTLPATRLRNSIPNTDRMPLRFIGQQWYLRKRLPSGMRLERGLGTANKDEATRRARQIVHETLNAEHLTAWLATVSIGLQMKGWLRQMQVNATRRSLKKGGSLDLGTLELIAVRSGGRCEVSGLPFHLGPENRHPFQPSLDRIDSGKGYEPGNLRMVALSVNYCMSHWGERIFLQISASMMARHLQKIASGGEHAGEKLSPESRENCAINS